MKQQLRLFITCISILVLLLCPGTDTLSCGPHLEADDTRIELFRQETAGSDALSAFYYTEHFLNGISGAGDDFRNCNEWATYTWGAAKVADIDTVMYSLPGADFVGRYISNNWEQYRNNTFIKWLLQPANAAAMAYMVLAKKVENEYLQRAVTYADQQWSSAAIMPSPNEEMNLKLEALKKCKAKIPLFLRQRYAFQAVKMMYYDNYYSEDTVICDADGGSRDNKPLMNCYEQFLDGGRTVVADWGRLYYGLSIADKRKRARELIKTFHGCDEKRTFIYSHLSAADVELLLATEHDSDMLAAIYTYKGIKNPGHGLPEIKEVMKYAPGSDYVKLLVVRELAKIDDWVLAPQLTGFQSNLTDRNSVWPEDYYRDTAYFRYLALNLAKDKQYVRQVTTYLASKYNDKSRDTFLCLAIAHLYNMDKQFAKAAAYLSRLPHFKSRVFEAQRLTENVINIMYTHDIKDVTVQDELGSQLQQLAAVYGPQIEEWDQWLANRAYMNPERELYLMLSRRYQELGDVVLAGLAFKKANLLVNDYYGYYDRKDSTFSYWYIDYYDKYAAPADIDSLLAFYHKKNKTTFERMIMHERQGKDEWYTELKGTLLLRQGKLEEALEVYNGLSDDYWETTYNFKEYLKAESISSAGSLLPVPTGSGKYYEVKSKKLILAEMVDLQHRLAKARTDSAIASLCFMLGNAYYNMTWGGRDWMMFSYVWSTNEPTMDYWAGFNFKSASEQTTNAYYKCTWASDMYMRALKHASKDKELKAKLLMMLSLTDTLRYTSARESIDKGLYAYRNSMGFPLSDYLEKLKKECSNTETYKAAIGWCPDIAGMEGVEFDYSLKPWKK